MDCVVVLFMEEGARVLFSLLEALRLDDKRVLDQSIVLPLKVLVLDVSVKSLVLLNVWSALNQLSERID